MNATKVLVAFLAVFSLFLAGCSNGEPDSANPPDNKAAPARREKIEMAPEGQPEYSIRHIYDDLDREIERHVNYRDGGNSSTFYREDGTTREFVSRDKSGKVKARKVYAADGKTVVEGQEVRSDGTVLWVLEQLKDGSTRKTTYWYDGVRAFSVETRRKDGSFEIVYHRKSGSVSGRKRGSHDLVTHEEYLDSSGATRYQVERNADGTYFLTHYRNGKPFLRQLWSREKTSWGGEREVVKQVEELDDSGKVTRRFTGSDSWSLEKTETFKADGSRIVRTYRPGGYVSKEETFDKDGNSTGVKEYKDNEYIRESPPWDGFWKPSLPDPERGWKEQEDYPWYREWRDE